MSDVGLFLKNHHYYSTVVNVSNQRSRVCPLIRHECPLLRNYINGFKKPSAEREKAIIDHIHKLGREMIAACF